MVDAGAGRGDDDLVEVAVEGDEAGAAAAGRPGQLGDGRAAGAELRHQREPGQQPGRPDALVRGPQRDQHAHPPVAAEPLHVVPRDQPAEAVPDDVHALPAGPGAQALDLAGQPAGGGPQVAGERAVGDGVGVLDAVAPQGTPQRGEDRRRPGEPVHQQHGCAPLCRLRRCGRFGLAAFGGRAPVVRGEVDGVANDLGRQ